MPEIDRERERGSEEQDDTPEMESPDWSRRYSRWHRGRCRRRQLHLPRRNLLAVSPLNFSNNNKKKVFFFVRFLAASMRACRRILWLISLN